MELTAAVVSVSVTKMLQSELDYENLWSVYYTDSEVVIGYIVTTHIVFTYMWETEYSTFAIAAIQDSGITCQERTILQTKRLVHLLPVSCSAIRDGSLDQTSFRKPMCHFLTRKNQPN